MIRASFLYNNHMEIPEFTISISANAVAWYGAIVATVGSMVGLYNVWKDRPRIKIKYEPGQYLVGNPALYSQDKKHLCITVVNEGIRPIRIDQAAVQQYNDKGTFILTDSFSDHRPKVIDEKSPKTTFATAEEMLDLDKVYRVIVTDGFGNRHIKYVKYFPTIPKLYFRIKNKFAARDTIKPESKK